MQIQKTEKILRNANLSINKESFVVVVILSSILVLIYLREYSKETSNRSGSGSRNRNHFSISRAVLLRGGISSDEITVGVIIISQYQYIETY